MRTFIQRSLRFRPEAWQALSDEARAEGKTLNAAVEEAIEQWAARKRRTRASKAAAQEPPTE